MKVETTCPRCGRPDPGRRFYGPCARCCRELNDNALRRSVWHRLLGLFTNGGWAPKESVSPQQWDALISKRRADDKARYARRRRPR